MMITSLYNKVFLEIDRCIDHWSRSRYIKSVTFVIAFLEACISPLPPEAFLLVVLAYRKDISWKILSFISAIGSTLGALFSYWVGYLFFASYGERIISFFHGEGLVSFFHESFAKNAFMAQFIAAITPAPDKVFTFLAGAFTISLPAILLGTFLGRYLRVLPVAYLSYEYGDEARVYIKKHKQYAVIGLVVAVALYIAFH